jgi:hypothetical protein
MTFGGVVAQVPPVPANADAVARSSNTPTILEFRVENNVILMRRGIYTVQMLTRSASRRFSECS